MFIEVKSMYYDRTSLAYIPCKGRFFINPDDVGSITIQEDETVPASICFKGDSHGQYPMMVSTEDAMKLIKH